MFTPKDGGYTFEAETRFGRLFAGVAVPLPDWMPTGTAGTEGIRPDDTFDCDYGRLLELRKGVTSPEGPNPFSLLGSVLSPA